jgi:hypothetical protein
VQPDHAAQRWRQLLCNQRENRDMKSVKIKCMHTTLDCKKTGRRIRFYSSSTFNSLVMGENMASPSLKDSDTISETSTLASTATADFAPKTNTKHNGFIALQTLLETPEPGASTSSSGAGETLVDSQAIIKRNKRREIYFIIGLTTFVCCAILAAILVVIFGPTRVAQG